MLLIHPTISRGARWIRLVLHLLHDRRGTRIVLFLFLSGLAKHIVKRHELFRFLHGLDEKGIEFLVDQDALTGILAVVSR